MYDKPRPPHVRHLGVTAEIDMRQISKAFTKKMMFLINHFLPLPQSSGRSKSTVPRTTYSSSDSTAPTLGTAEVLDANVFSPPLKKGATIDLNRRAFDLEAGLVTPVTTSRRLNSRIDHEDSDSEADPDATDPADSESVNVNLTPEDVQTQADIGVVPPQGDPSMFTMLSKSPKSTALIMENQTIKPGSSKMVWTYEGPIGILDSQDTFREQIPMFDDFYELSLNSNGQRNVQVKKILEKKFRTIKNIVQLRVFCYEFKKFYIGNNDNSVSQITATIQNCASRLSNVKMITKDYVTNQFITISPDTFYSRMLELV
jgi:hypothetical protein